MSADVKLYLFMAICTAIAAYDKRTDEGATSFIANCLLGVIWPVYIAVALIRRIVRN